MEKFYFVSVSATTDTSILCGGCCGTPDYLNESRIEGCCCHTNILDALRKCDRNGYIYVYDKYGRYVEDIYLMSPRKVKDFMKYLDPEAYSTRKLAMEWALSDQSSVSMKGFFRSRYNPDTKVNDFKLKINCKTRRTRLDFTKTVRVRTK